VSIDHEDLKRKPLSRNKKRSQVKGTSEKEE